MPNYDLSRLGSTEFEHLVQSILKKVIGAGTITFGAGKDGAREATYVGSAPYPSEADRFNGKWIFQAKYHDVELLGVAKARKQVLSELDDELDKIVNKYKHRCDNYILATNVPLTGVVGSGNIDLISNEIIPKYSAKIKNIHIWGADDIQRYLEIFGDIRTSYLHFIVAGDVLYQLIQKNDQEIDDVAITVKEYLKVLYTREQNAQLDQAGDVSDDPVRIQQVFFDLLATYDRDVSSMGLKQLMEFNHRHGEVHSQGRDNVWSPLSLLTSDTIKDLVLIGGPGEGKSTIGQFLAQMHRARLTGQSDELNADNSYTPAVPRIPFRVVLRDFAQWLARPDPDGSQPARTLDEYFTTHIRQATSRSISTKELHRLIQENPTLLIFDGLDEVSGEDIRRSLLERIAEFTDRCRSTLKADVQILAATRPTGYSNQFDPKVYLHLRLVKLVPDQVRDYVAKWINARTLDPSKADHLQENIEECLVDPQIRLLTNTPLQVTILVLIISAGGSPPRQREALFDEYLNVIYKRETGKGKNVISSEREKLVGLHEYIGYILHEKATSAEAASAVMKRPDYEREVTNYLKYCDPFSERSEIKAIQRAITRDAGERLVLLVEPQPDQFGFELRSIQEFFAACHMADTSTTTEMRFRRFDAIARLDHWRNVALYFAGRVGRNYSGETGNIIEVCHNLNRETHSSTVQRGSILALELAADRAFGHNRRSQRRLLEIGLEVLERSVSRSRLDQIIDLLQKLPAEDIRHHVNVLLKQKLELLDSTHILQYPEVISSCHADTELQRVAIGKLARNRETKLSALESIFTLGLTVEKTGEAVVKKLVEAVTIEELTRLFGSLPGIRFLFSVERSVADGVPESILWDCLSRLVISGQAELQPFVSLYRISLARIPLQPLPSSLPATFVACMLISSLVVQLETEHMDSSNARTRRQSKIHMRLRESLPKSVLDGNLILSGNKLLEKVPSCLKIAPWVAHILLGDVTKKSAREFVSYLIEHKAHSCVTNFTAGIGFMWRPAIGLIMENLRCGEVVDVDDAADLIYRHGGSVRGFNKSQELQYKVARMPHNRLEFNGVDKATQLSESEAEYFGFTHPCTTLEVQLVTFAAIRVARLRGDLLVHATEKTIRSALAEVAKTGYITEANHHLFQSYDFQETASADLTYELAFDVASTIGNKLATRNDLSFRLFLEYLYVSYHKLDLDTRKQGLLLAALSRFKFLPAPAMFTWLNRRVIINMINHGLSCVIARQSAALVAGAQRLFEIVASSSRVWRNHSGDRTINFSFKGFAEAHRSYADAAETEDDIRAALSLFILRKLNSNTDLKSLQRLLARASKENVAYFFEIIPGEVLRRADQRDLWIELVSSLMPDSQLGVDHATLVDVMTVLLAEADQSLAQHEHELGLPLVIESS